MNKLITLDEAAARVFSGATLSLGGVTLYRRPLAFVAALLRRFRATGAPRDLTLLNFTSGMESDLLVGSGMVRCIRTCYFGLEIFGLAPMFTYYANRGQIEILEESEVSLSMGLRAAMAGVGFMPGRGWLGTDLPSLRPDVRTVTDPYSGEELAAFPALHPDITVLHALQADLAGNAVIGDHKGADEELVLAGRQVLVTADEIVPELLRAGVPAPLVDAVALAPGGARPTSCHPLYALDGQALLAYSEQVSDPASYEAFVARWLDSAAATGE